MQSQNLIYPNQFSNKQFFEQTFEFQLLITNIFVEYLTFPNLNKPNLT
jgi:hypothetical protein